jgi:hypothetical protein
MSHREMNGYGWMTRVQFPALIGISCVATAYIQTLGFIQSVTWVIIVAFSLSRLCGLVTISESCVKKDLEGSGRGIINVLCRHLPGGADENRENLIQYSRCTGQIIPVNTGNFFPEIEQPGCDTDHSVPLSGEVKMRRPLPRSFMRLHFVVFKHKDTLP